MCVGACQRAKISTPFLPKTCDAQTGLTLFLDHTQRSNLYLALAQSLCVIATCMLLVAVLDPVHFLSLIWINVRPNLLCLKMRITP